MLTQPEYSVQDIQEANLAQRQAGPASRARGERYNFSAILTGQCAGPLQKFAIPHGHSRQSRYPLFRKALTCKTMPREVDFDRLLAVFGSEAAEIDEAIDDIPLDLLSEMWQVES